MLKACLLRLFVICTLLYAGDIWYDEKKLVLGESGCFETIVYHFYRDDFWDDQCTVFVFHPDYRVLDGEPAIQMVLVNSHKGKRPEK